MPEKLYRIIVDIHQKECYYLVQFNMGLRRRGL